MSEKKENKKEQTETPENEERDVLAEMKDLLQRTQANFENYRKQTEKRIEDIRAMASKDIILQVLPVLDNFELALKNNDHTSEFTQGTEKSKISCTPTKTFVEGVELIYSQLFSVLENNGITVIKKKEFDPFYHEALMKVDSKLPENTIVEELQKGFMLHDKVIRHTKVKISSGICKEDKECKK